MDADQGSSSEGSSHEAYHQSHDSNAQHDDPLRLRHADESGSQYDTITQSGPQQQLSQSATFQQVLQDSSEARLSYGQHTGLFAERSYSDSIRANNRLALSGPPTDPLSTPGASKPAYALQQITSRPQIKSYTARTRSTSCEKKSDGSIDSDMLSIPGTDDLRPQAAHINLNASLGAIVNLVVSKLIQQYRSVTNSRSTDPATTLSGTTFIQTHGSGSTNANSSARGKKNIGSTSGSQSTFNKSGQQSSRDSNSGYKRAGDEDNQELRPPPKRATADAPDGQVVKKHFACPFWKHEPHRQRPCFRVMLTKISYVKQHLHRVHYRETYCERCLHVSPDKESHHVHLQQQCEYRPSELLDWISHEQHHALSRKSNKAYTETQKWFVIWDIVMPGKPRPTSPYMEPGLSQDIHEFQEYLLLHGPGTLRREIEAAGVSLESGDTNEENLFQVAANRAFDMLFQHWATGRPEEESSRNALVPAGNGPEVTASERPLFGESLLDSGIEVENPARISAVQHGTSLPVEPEASEVSRTHDSSTLVAPEADVNSDPFGFEWDIKPTGLAWIHRVLKV
ncbi:hypothetical protein PG985_012918 [Apiospora marii]|uniref:C2H2-type domain-containing protein n=1 Tax=Apiospora marii TaxID=335849 RepID=A0ABR1RC78_9PEZI